MIAKLLMSVSVLLIGFACAWFYLRGPALGPGNAASPFVGYRPWRRVGAAICLLLSVMFVIGVYAVDIPARPAPYAIYWIVMLGLVVWLFALAVRDVMYTRELIRRWRRNIADETDSALHRNGQSAEHRNP